MARVGMLPLVVQRIWAPAVAVVMERKKGANWKPRFTLNLVSATRPRSPVPLLVVGVGGWK